LNCKYNSDAICRHNLSCIDGFIQKKDCVEKCDIYSLYQDAQALKFLLKSNGFPKSTFTSKFEDYKGDDEEGNLLFLREYINSFSEESDNIYFYGDSDTQKSTIARTVGKELLKKKFSCKYILADELVRLLAREEREDEIRDYIDKLITVDFLIIDDFEKSKMVLYESGWQLKFIYPFLKRRIDIIQKPILIISNFEIKKIEKDFDYSTYSLINREINKSMQFKDLYSYESSKSNFDSLKTK